MVKLNRIENNILHIEKVDVINDTPLLDIKPYVPDFDKTEDIQIGWLSESRQRMASAKSDERFYF